MTGDATVFEAAKAMTEHGIGAVPVVLDGDLIGIFTERWTKWREGRERRAA